jgi:hypothetical protein
MHSRDQSLKCQEDFARLVTGFRVDRIVVEAVGQWPGFDLTCRVSIDAPNLSVALDLFAGLLTSRDAYQINPARAVFNRLLAIAFQQLLPEQPVALDLPAQALSLLMIRRSVRG